MQILFILKAIENDGNLYICRIRQIVEGGLILQWHQKYLPPKKVCSTYIPGKAVTLMDVRGAVFVLIISIILCLFILAIEVSIKYIAEKASKKRKHMERLSNMLQLDRYEYVTDVGLVIHYKAEPACVTIDSVASDHSVGQKSDGTVQWIEQCYALSDSNVISGAMFLPGNYKAY